MIFWIAAIGFSAITLFALARPILRANRAPEIAGEKDLKVFQDQMESLANDVSRGLVNEADAEATRAEIGRRMLDADKRMQDQTAASTSSTILNRGLVGAIVIGLLGGTFGLYAMLGSAGFENQPLAKRLASLQDQRKNRPSQAEVEANQPVITIDADPDYISLVDQLRTAATERPNDKQGWSLLATHETRLANFAAARTAQEHLIGLYGEEVPLPEYVNLTEIMVLAAGGYVSPESETILVNVLKADPRDPRARYYSGLFMAQTGRADVAYRMWSGLLDEGPEDAPWIAAIRQDIVAVARAAGVTLAPNDLPGPNSEDIANAQDMSSEDRLDMIQSMVAGLSERLATEGGSASEWARLIRAYGVLEETGSANTIWTEAKTVFASDPAAIALLLEAARAAEIAN